MSDFDDEAYQAYLRERRRRIWIRVVVGLVCVLALATAARWLGSDRVGGDGAGLLKGIGRHSVLVSDAG